MIIKSYDIKKNLLKLLKYNFFLLYGENEGLKKDIKETITTTLKKKDTNIEILSIYENNVTDDEENFFQFNFFRISVF